MDRPWLKLLKVVKHKIHLHHPEMDRNLNQLQDMMESESSSLKSQLSSLTSRVTALELENQNKNQTLRQITSRDVLKAIRQQKSRLLEKNKKLTLVFLSQQESKAPTSLLFLIRKANHLAHKCSIEYVYETLTDFDVFTEISTLYQKRFRKNSRFHKLSDHDLITLIFGLPKYLTEYAISMSLF